MPANLCTHIVYAFVLPAWDGQLQSFDDTDTLQALVDLRIVNPELKVMAAIGGWSAGAAVFSNIMADATLRQTFAQSVADFVRQHRLDGIDLDWEYPNASDRDNFVEFLRTLRTLLGWSTLVSAAVGSDVTLVGTAYDAAGMAEQLDFINLMTYDYHTASDMRTGQNAPLFASSVDSTGRPLNADATVNAWLAGGAAAGKLLLGVAFYGRTYQLADEAETGVGAPAVDAGAAGPYTQQPGVLSYLEICQAQHQGGGWTTVYDTQQQAAYSFDGDQWVGYDNVQSIEYKSAYAIDRGLGGVMVWAVDEDDANGACGGGSMPLLNAIRSQISA